MEVPNFGLLDDENTCVEIREKCDKAINEALWTCYEQVKVRGSGSGYSNDITENKVFLEERIAKKLDECCSMVPPPNMTLEIISTVTTEAEDYGDRTIYGVIVSYSLSKNTK